MTVAADAPVGVYSDHIKLDFTLISPTAGVTSLSVQIPIQATIVQIPALCAYDANQDNKIDFDEAKRAVADYLLEKANPKLGRPPTFDETVEVVKAYLLEKSFTCPDEGILSKTPSG